MDWLYYVASFVVAFAIGFFFGGAYVFGVAARLLAETIEEMSGSEK